jgi:hypothetical protein
MQILGLEPGALIIILQAVATYAALLSAYFFVRPVLRGQTVDASHDILAALKSDDRDVEKLLEQASGVLIERKRRNQPKSRRDNAIGVLLLVVSLLLFTGAVALQVLTDPAFHPSAGPAHTRQP